MPIAHQTAVDVGSMTGGENLTKLKCHKNVVFAEGIDKGDNNAAASSGSDRCASRARRRLLDHPLDALAASESQTKEASMPFILWWLDWPVLVAGASVIFT